MRKIGALFHNELVKLSKRVSILVIVIIMVAVTFLIGGFLKFIEMAEDSYESYEYVSDNSWIEEQKQYCEEELSRIDSEIAKASDDIPLTIRFLQQKVSILAERDYYDLLLEYNINFQDGDSYENQIAYEIQNLKSQIYTYEYITIPFYSTSSGQALMEDLITQAAALKEILAKKDYPGYIAYKRTVVGADQTLSAEEKEMELEYLSLLVKLEPEGGNTCLEKHGYSAVNIASKVKSYRKSLLYNLNYTGAGFYEYSYTASSDTGSALSPTQRENIENQLAVLLYKIDNDIPISTSTTYSAKPIAVSIVSAFNSVLITALMLIIAGGLISSEISSGTIKSLIITPVRRWKIFFAKFLALCAVGVLLTLIKYILVISMSSLFWGFSGNYAYIYAIGGVAGEINYYLYQLLYMGLELIPIIVFATFAFMLSVVTRNTALSVGVSLAIYFGGDIVISIINQFSTGEWIKYLPFNNLNIAEMVFPYTEDLYGSMMTMGILGIENPVLSSISTSFSLCYLGILMICMWYTAFDSFTRRDM